MGIRGPKFKTRPPADNAVQDLSAYVKKTGARMTGRLNMGGKKITELAEPTNPQDAATEGYVSNYASHLNNIKLDKTGGTLTGDLAMSNSKITDLGTPAEDKDAVTKEYVDIEISRHWHNIKLKSIGRYILFPNSLDGSENTYFSVRPRKNFDLSNGRIVAIDYHDQESNNLNVEHNLLRTTISQYTTLHQNDNKDLGTFTLTFPMSIRFRAPRSAPWTLIFSANPGNPEESQRSRTMLDFDQNKTLKFEWDETSFTHKIKQNQRILAEKTVKVNTDEFHHFAFTYANRIFTFYLDGEKLKEHNAPSFNQLVTIILGFAKMGLLHFYDRKLKEMEIVEHFVDFHLENFTNNHKVLI